MIAGQLELRMFANLARLQSDMDAAKRMVGTATQQIESAAAKATAALAGIGIGTGVTQFAGMIRGSIDAADHLNDLSKSTGIAVEQLAGLKLAAKQSGSDLDGVATSINKLSVNIGKDGEKFKALGVTAKDPLEAFKQLSDVFLAIKDPQLRAAVGAEALGKSWATAAPLLMEGGEEIQKMIDKGTALSHVNTEMAQQADAFNDKLTELTGTGGLMNSMTASLLPLLNLVADELLDMHKKSEGANDGFSLLAETFRAVVVLGGNVAFVFKGVGREIGGVAAQLAAFGSGDFKGALAIGDMMKSDAAQARNDFDAWENKVMTAGKRIAGAYSGYTSGQSEPKGIDPATAAAQARAKAFLGGDKGKAAKDDNAAFNDAINAQIEALKKFQAIKEMIAKQTVDRVTSEQKRGMVTELDFINQVAQAEKYAMATAITSLEQQKTLAAEKKNSMKEVAALEGQIAAAKEKQQGRELAQGYAILELAFKIAAERQAFYNTADHANIAQLDGLRDKNTASQLELEAIGLTKELMDKLTLSRQNDAIATQAQKVATMQFFNASGQSSEAIQIEIDKLNELKRAKGLTADIQSKTALVEEEKKAKQEQIDLWKQIDSTAESVFMDIAKNGTSAFKHLEEELKNGLLKLLYEMTVKKWIISIGSDMAGFDISGLLGGGSGGNPLAKMAGDWLMEGAGSLFGGGSAVVGAGAGAGVTTTTLAGIEAASAGLATVGTTAAAAGGATAAAGVGLGGMATAALAAIPVVGWVALGIGALFAIFGSGKDKIPTVLNDLALFNNSLVGLPFLELAIGSDDAAQGLRDVLYGLENATPTMRKLAGETIQLSVELMRASGDIAGARNLARNLGTRGMSEAEIAVFDYNEGLRDQIEAQHAAAAAASAGAAAAQAAEQAENTLAQTRWNLAGKLNILLGRTTQLEFDRATALAATTDATSIAMLTLTYRLEDLYTAVDANYATLERSVAAEKKVLDEQYAAQKKATEQTYAAERKVIDLRLKGSQDLANLLKSTKDAISPLMGRAFAQSQIAMYVALARAGGVLPTAAALAPALDAIAKPSEDLFKTFAEYAIDQARTANDISDLSGLADKQLTEDEKALALMESTYGLAKEQLDATIGAAKAQLDATVDAAKTQLDAIKGIDTSVTNVANAVLNFEASMMALSGAQSTAAAFNYAAPAAASSYGGGGGGGGYSGGGASSAASATAGMDSDIVAAYNAYYGRAPDQSGYDNFIKSGLTGDAMMQAILHASIADKTGADYNYALAHGYDPENPLSNYYHGTGKYKATTASSNNLESFAIGSNYIDRDQIAQIHQGEEITPRPYVDMQRASRDETNALMARLVASNERLEAKIARLEAAASQTAANTGATMRKLDDMSNESGGLSLSVVVAA